MVNLSERYRLSQLMQKQEDGGKKIRLRWNSPTEVRRSLAKVNNMVLNAEITAKEANAVYYSANLTQTSHIEKWVCTLKNQRFYA